MTLHRLVGVAAVVVVAGAVPVRRVAGIHQGLGLRAGTLLVAFVVLGFAATGNRVERQGRWPLFVGFAVALMATFALVVGGRIVGVWTVSTALLALWTVPGCRLEPLGSFDRRSLPPVVGVSVAAAVMAGSPTRLPIALAVSALAWGVALFTAGRGDRVVRGTEMARRRVTVVVGAAGLGCVWVPFVLVPWVFQRLVRFDPLQPPRRSASSTFVQRVVRDPEPGRAWFLDTALKRPSLSRRVHARMPLLLIVACAATSLWWFEVRPMLGSPISVGEEHIATGSDSDLSVAGRQLVAATDQAISETYLSHYVGVELRDMTSELLNIDEGRRRTWSPRSCTGQQVTVWMFGGSTLFGVYQRDDRTIASELARLGWERGVRLEVENFGVPGDVTWQMNRRFERALAGGERPDVAIYFDGWNDLRFVADMDFTGRNPATRPDFIGPLDRLHLRALGSLGGVEEGRRYLLSVPELGPALPSERILELASRQYASAHASATAMTQQHGVGFVHLFQPSVHTRSPGHPSDPAADPRFARLVRDFRDQLPDGVVDIADALDDLDSAVYLDEVHTTGSASRTIAQSIWRSSSTELTDAAQRKGAVSCP